MPLQIEDWISLLRGMPLAEEERFLSLSQREREVFQLVGEGRSNREVALILGLSPRTVEKHLENLRAKLGAENRGAVIRLWTREFEPIVWVGIAAKSRIVPHKEPFVGCGGVEPTRPTGSR